MAKKTLLEHVAYELTRAGVTDDPDERSRKIAESVMALAKRFDKQDHDDYTGKWTLEFFETLLNFMPISAITDSPEEWEEFEIKTKNVETGEEDIQRTWQSKRCPAVFSKDAGKTWWNENTGKEGVSRSHDDWLKEKEEKRLAYEEEQKAKAKAEEDAAKKAEAPNVLADAPAPTKAKPAQKKKAKKGKK